MERWHGKTAVVTGASAGIGAAVCVALADAGVRVVGLARRPQLVDKLQLRVRGEGTISSRQCDVSKCEEVAAAFKWVEENCGGTHILVNNAGVLNEGHITDVGYKQLSEEALISTIDVNLKGPIFCARHAVASMKRNDFKGHIVNINSVAGHYIPSLHSFNVYPATKHAITAFTAALNNEFTEFKSSIKTTSISPGLVRTEMAGAMVAPGAQPELQPGDVADALLYALSTPPNVNINELTVTSVTEKSL